tara:strand:+ start:749 stop:916 length:168 start_codon:yes stop_codon:yes gene_type:complete
MKKAFLESSMFSKSYNNINRQDNTIKRKSSIPEMNEPIKFMTKERNERLMKNIQH